MNHVVHAVKISREQFDRLTTLTAQLERRYQGELDRSKELDSKERETRVREVLRNYSTEWMKGAAEILTASQLARYRDLGSQGNVSELQAGPEVLQHQKQKEK